MTLHCIAHVIPLSLNCEMFAQVVLRIVLYGKMNL